MRWIVFAAMMLATPAFSLSCSPPDPVSDYKFAEDSPVRWGIAVGRLNFDPGRVPVVDWERQNDVPPSTDIRAQFVGQSIDAGGFVKPFQANVTLRVNCVGPWCASPQNGARYLAFIKHEKGKRVINANPCGSMLYINPPKKYLDQVYQCFVGGRCVPSGF